ncbi:MAG: PAS domain S-box protein [Deltaproteobacteria bacterium]|nr:PAS domain S-box protein [Deltaproteobacteria bacterium]
MTAARILIVEHEHPVAARLEEELKTAGYVCASVLTGQDAVAAAAERPPDLALIDLELTGEPDGVETAQHLSETLDTPVLYLNGNAGQALERRSLDSEPAGYVPKTAPAGQLHLHVETALRLHVRQRRQRRASAAVECATEAIVVTDKGGGITFMNSAAETLTGWSRHEAIGRSLGEIFHGAAGVLPVQFETRQRLIEEGGDHARTGGDMMLRTRSGKEVAIDYNVAPVKDRNGRAEGTVLAFHRIDTEQLAHGIREEARAWRILMESTNDGIIVIDERGNPITRNTSAERMVGPYRPDSGPEDWSEGYGVFKLDGVTQYPSLDLPIARTLRGESTDDEEMIVRNPAKPEGIYINTSARPLLDDSGKLKGGLAVFRDITATKRSEAELRQAVERLESQTRLMESVFDSISDGVVAADSQGNYLVVNTAAKRLAELISPVGIKDLMMADLAEYPAVIGLYRPDRKTPFPADELPLRRALQGEASDDVAILVRNSKVPNGVYFNTSGRPLQDASNSIKGAVVVFRDVTEQMRAHEALARAFAQGRLEIVETVLHNIGNAINSVAIGIGTLHGHLKGSRSIRRLQALVEALKAHEHDWIDYLRDDPKGRQAMPFLFALANDFGEMETQLVQTVERVRDRVAYITEIVRTQQAFDKDIMARKDVDLEETIDTAVEILQDSISRRGIWLHVDCVGTPAQVRIRENQFHQMIVNLVKNSIEAIDELPPSGALNGPPEIHIRSYVKDEFLVIDVIDNGVGIDPNDLKGIFASGYTTKDTGSGLGLHSSVNYVAGVGGSIVALSDGIGTGSTLRVRLGLSFISLEHSSSSVA